MPPDDRQLAKRLTRDAQVAAKASARAERAYVKAVARRQRKLREARRALPWGIGTAVVGGSSAVLLYPDGVAVLVWGAAVAGGLRAVSAVRTLRRPPPVPQRPAAALPAAPPPPSPRSAAFPAVRRLESVREALTRLVPLVSPAGRDAATEAWQAAAEADLALRWQAARCAAVEPHRGVDRDLLEQLMAGVKAQEALVDAVVDLVAASADPLATRRLQDATDAVLGLAQGLREVR